MPSQRSFSSEAGMFLRTYASASSDRPPTRLFIHGLGESGLCFEELLGGELLGDMNALVPDLPGYGRSAWPQEVSGLAATADHLTTWLEQRRQERVIVVGHSMGGVLATLMGERCPERVLAVVNVDGNLSLDDCVFSGEAAGQDLEAFAATGFDRLRDAVYQAGIADRAQRGYYASLRLACAATFLRHSEELVELSRPEDLAIRMSALSMPSLYIGGDPRGVSLRSRRLLDAADVTARLIAPSGHWPFIDQPKAFAAQLREYCRSV